MLDKTTTLLFLRRNDELLLAMKKRGFGSGLWNGVGGKLDPGETVEQALVRECQEEINVTPTIYTKVAEHNFLMDSDMPESWRMFVHTFIAIEWEGEPMETEEMAPLWYKLSDIPYEKMWADDPHWLPPVLAAKLLRTNFTFDSHDTLLETNVQEVARW